MIIVNINGVSLLLCVLRKKEQQQGHYCLAAAVWVPDDWLEKSYPSLQLVRDQAGRLEEHPRPRVYQRSKAVSILWWVNNYPTAIAFILEVRHCVHPTDNVLRLGVLLQEPGRGWVRRPKNLHLQPALLPRGRKNKTSYLIWHNCGLLRAQANQAQRRRPHHQTGDYDYDPHLATSKYYWVIE